MTEVRTIALEFLRKGPAHNQLLSPLIDYLAVLGDYKATTVTVPYDEHAEVLSVLKDLSDTSKRGQSRRKKALHETAQKIAEILARVEGLNTELNGHSPSNDLLLHLKFVISANELALLPFELGKVTIGAPANAKPNWLALMSSPRVCITRQIRSVTGEKVRWPDKPKILFLWADPEFAVPVKEHTLALLDTVKPWIPYFDQKKSGDFQRAAKRMLTILPNATIKDVRAACSKHIYTHVHILAHGYASSNTLGSPVGIGLHSAARADKVDIILGRDFTRALGNTLPVVVTVSACDSGTVRSVIHKTGVSFAHDLHHAGVPFVVASQFPLSVSGSVDMVKTFYKKVLWSEDPRTVLHELRSILHSNQTNSHDWAGLVAYTALPPDLDNQLVDARYAGAKSAIDAAMDHIDTQIQHVHESGNVKNFQVALAQWRTRVKEATKHMPLERRYGYETEGHGLLGSAEKRTAEALFNVCSIANMSKRSQFLDDSVQALEKALEYYHKAFHANIQETREIVRIKRSVHWVLCQYLSLCAVLGKPLPSELWGMARVAAELDTQVPPEIDKKGEIRVWGHGTLWELYLLVLAYPDKALPVDHTEARVRAKAHVNVIRKLGTFDDRFPVKSTRRQIDRYCKWWCHDLLSSHLKHRRERDWSESGSVKELAEELATLLPDK
jgi:hypothetical protein